VKQSVSVLISFHKKKGPLEPKADLPNLQLQYKFPFDRLDITKSHLRHSVVPILTLRSTSVVVGGIREVCSTRRSEDG